MRSLPVQASCPQLRGNHRDSSSHGVGTGEAPCRTLPEASALSIPPLSSQRASHGQSTRAVQERLQETFPGPLRCLQETSQLEVAPLAA